MHNFFYTIGLFFFFNLVSGQEYVLEYSFSDMLANKSTADLIIQGDESVFKVKDDSNTTNTTKSPQEKGNTFVFVRKNTDALSTFSYTTQDEIFVRIPYVKGKEKEFVYKFETKELNWKITNETKQIDKYICQKASLVLHGRYHEVWFTTEVPIKFGPFRLNGLPGMIVEARISVDSHAFTTGSTWKLLSVTNKKNDKVFDFHKQFFSDHTVMEYPAYEKAASEEMLNFKRKKLAKSAAFDAKWAKEHGTEATSSMTYEVYFFTGYLFDIPEGIVEKLDKLN